eukprot:g35306.t1
MSCALLDTKNRKYRKLTGAYHPKRASSTSQIPNPTQDLPHNVPAAIGHEATVGEPTDDVTSATAGYPTSGTANANAADATTSISETNTTDTEDAPTITAAAAYPAPPTADTAPPITDAEATPPTTDATPPTANANATPPTASTASSSRGDSSTQPCR